MIGANRREGEPIARTTRPQYHFFYGSTDDGSGAAAAGAQHEQESLIGESLVPTDNEEEQPNSNDFDLQHVLISNGDGGVRHVVGGSDNRASLKARSEKRNGSNGHQSSNGGIKSFGYSLLNLRDNHPVAHVVSLVGCMTLCMVIFAVTLFPSKPQSATDAASNIDPARKFVLQFPIVDRSKYDPVPAFLNKELLHPDFLYQGKDPFKEFTFAFPTGAFWTNLVLPPTAEQGFSYPIAVYPYAYKWSDYLMSVSYPAVHRKEEAKAIHDYYFPDLTFGSTEEVKQRHIDYFDPLSVSLIFQTSNKGAWHTYLVQGSPYVTLEYDNVTPSIKALSTFKDVLCPGEESIGEEGDEEFDDNFSDEDDNSGNSRRRLFGVCSASVSRTGCLNRTHFDVELQHWSHLILQ
jgi:hypothetical protein